MLRLPVARKRQKRKEKISSEREASFQADPQHLRVCEARQEVPAQQIFLHSHYKLQPATVWGTDFTTDTGCLKMIMSSKCLIIPHDSYQMRYLCIFDIRMYKITSLTNSIGSKKNPKQQIM